MESKFNPVKFGISGAIVSLIFMGIVEIFLWQKLVPIYLSIMQSAYQVDYTSQVVHFFITAVIISIVLGFALSWLFAWIYNKLLMVKVK